MINLHSCTDSRCRLCRCTFCWNYINECSTPWHHEKWIWKRKKWSHLSFLIKKMEEATCDPCAAFMLTQATPGVFFVEINKRLPFTAVYKKQYSLPNWISLSKSFEEEGPLNVFHLRRENSKWHLREKIPVCSNLVITLFKSKLLVFIYIENLFLFLFFL